MGVILFPRVVVLWTVGLHGGRKAVCHPGSQLLGCFRWKVRSHLGSHFEVNSSDYEGKEERSYWWRVLASEMGFLADLRGLAGKREREEEAPTEAERIMKQASCTWPGGDASESEGDLSVDWDLSIISGGHFYMDLE